MILSIETKGLETEELRRQVGIPPDQVERVELPWGKAVGFWAESKAEAAEFVLLLELNAAFMNREEHHLAGGHPIQAHVHPDAYSSNSMMAVALERMLNPNQQSSGIENASPVHLKLSLSAVKSNLPQENWASWCQGWGFEQDIVALTEDAAGGRNYFDVELRGRMTLASAVQAVRALLTALDADHVQHLGKEQTIAIAQGNDQHFADHPDLAAIRQAILTAPSNAIRISKGSLVEPIDRFVSSPPRVHFVDDNERNTLHAVFEGKLKAAGVNSVLVLLPENEALIYRLAANPAVQRCHIQDLLMENIQRVASRLRESDLADNAKQKISFSSNSPTYSGQHLEGFEAIILETGTTALPSDRRSALLSALLRHSGARLVAFFQRLDGETKLWANAETAKAHDRAFEMVVPKVAGGSKTSPMALVLFHSNRA